MSKLRKVGGVALLGLAGFLILSRTKQQNQLPQGLGGSGGGGLVFLPEDNAQSGFVSPSNNLLSDLLSQFNATNSGNLPAQFLQLPNNRVAQFGAGQETGTILGFGESGGLIPLQSTSRSLIQNEFRNSGVGADTSPTTKKAVGEIETSRRATIFNLATNPQEQQHLALAGISNAIKKTFGGGSRRTQDAPRSVDLFGQLNRGIRQSFTNGRL